MLSLHKSRLSGGLSGLLVGDALGVPYEFHHSSALPPVALIEMTPPAGFRRAHSGVPPGTWSDDGAQALVLLESLLRRGELDLEDFGAGLVRWYRDGWCTPDGVVFDVGIQTRHALSRIESGIPTAEAGPSGERDNGNGALMRVLPLALWHRGDDRELAFLAARQGLPTHGHVRSMICCALYCLWARIELQGRDGWTEACAALPAHAEALGWPADEVQHVLSWGRSNTPTGSGYVLDSLWSAKSALDAGTDYASVVRHAIAFGNDTDTTACIAGGIAGIRYGIDGIPAEWKAALRGRELVRDLLDRPGGLLDR